MAAILNSAILHKTLIQTNSIWLKLIHYPSTWWRQPSSILLTWFQPFCTKNFTHSFSLNLMMAAILNSANLDSATAILNSDTLLSCLRFTQKHSPTNLTLTQTNLIWLKLIHCSSTWWDTLVSDSTWWWQPSWILPCWFQTLSSWIQTPGYLLSDSPKNTLPPLWLWLKLIQSNSNSFILT